MVGSLTILRENGTTRAAATMKTPPSVVNSWPRLWLHSGSSSFQCTVLSTLQHAVEASYVFHCKLAGELTRVGVYRVKCVPKLRVRRNAKYMMIKARTEP